MLSSLVGAASAAWQVGVLRAGAWAARGLRTPSRNALLADAVEPAFYGRAYGFERAMDNLGAVVGPLLALALVAATSVRVAIFVSVVPGLLATLAIVYAVRHTGTPRAAERRPLRIRVRPVLRGRLGGLMLAVAAFETGNIAATLLILRATDLLQPGRGHDRAVEIALLLYTLYNLAGTLTSLPAGRAADRRGPVAVLATGIACFLAAYVGFALAGPSIAVLAACFLAAGIAIGCAETAEHAAVAALASEELRGSAFGLLAAVQSFGNLVASAVAGILWSAVSPAAGLLFAAALMAVALAVLAVMTR